VRDVGPASLLRVICISLFNERRSVVFPSYTRSTTVVPTRQRLDGNRTSRGICVKRHAQHRILETLDFQSSLMVTICDVCWKLWEDYITYYDVNATRTTEVEDRSELLVVTISVLRNRRIRYNSVKYLYLYWRDPSNVKILTCKTLVISGRFCFFK